MWLTIPLILLTCGLAVANAWVSGHTEELAVQVKPTRAWLPKAGFWLAVVGLSGTLFTILLPVLASFVHLETDGGYLNPAYFIANLWPLFLLLAAALTVNLVMLVNSVKAPKPKASVEGAGQRRYGYYGYPRSFFIFMPMRSHRRIAASPRYYPAAYAPAASNAMSGGLGAMGSGYQAASSGGMRGSLGAMSSGATSGGMSGGLSGGSGAGGYGTSGGMRGGMSSSSNSKKSYKSDNNRSMNGNAGLVMLAVLAVTGGYQGAKAVKKMGGKRQAEINHLWRTAEAQRVIREHDEEQEAKLKAEFESALHSGA